MTTANHDNPPLWQFIPLTQYKLPPEPAAERVQRGLRGLWSRVMGQGKAADESPDQNDFRMIPEAALDLIAGLPEGYDSPVGERAVYTPDIPVDKPLRDMKDQYGYTMPGLKAKFAQ